MSTSHELSDIVCELISILRLQTAELEKLVTHVESQTGRLGEASRLAIVASDLSALHVRMQRLLGTSS
jgi:hypothetical protein